MKRLIIKKKNIIKYKIYFIKEEKVFRINNIKVKIHHFYDFINNYLLYFLKSFNYVKVEFYLYKRKILSEKTKPKMLKIVIHNYLNMLTSKQ